MSDIIATWKDVKSHYIDQSSYDDNKCMTKSEILTTAKPINTSIKITDENLYQDNQLVPLHKIAYNMIAVQTNPKINRLYSFTGSSLSGNYKELESVAFDSNIIMWNKGSGLGGTLVLEGYVGLPGSASNLTCTVDGINKPILTTPPGQTSTTLVGSFWVSLGSNNSFSTGNHIIQLSRNTDDFSISYIVSSYLGEVEPQNYCTIVIQNPSTIPSTGGSLILDKNGYISNIFMTNTLNTYSTDALGATITGWTDLLVGSTSNRTVTIISNSNNIPSSGTTTGGGRITIRLN